MDPPLRIGQLPCAAHEISHSICHDLVQYTLTVPTPLADLVVHRSVL